MSVTECLSRSKTSSRSSVSLPFVCSGLGIFGGNLCLSQICFSVVGAMYKAHKILKSGRVLWRTSSLFSHFFQGPDVTKEVNLCPTPSISRWRVEGTV